MVEGRQQSNSTVRRRNRRAAKLGAESGGGPVNRELPRKEGRRRRTLEKCAEKMKRGRVLWKDPPGLGKSGTTRMAEAMPRMRGSSLQADIAVGPCLPLCLFSSFRWSPPATRAVGELTGGRRPDQTQAEKGTTRRWAGGSGEAERVFIVVSAWEGRGERADGGGDGELASRRLSTRGRQGVKEGIASRSKRISVLAFPSGSSVGTSAGAYHEGDLFPPPSVNPEPSARAGERRCAAAAGDGVK